LRPASALVRFSLWCGGLACVLASGAIGATLLSVGVESGDTTPSGQEKMFAGKEK
jgi:hypothetical protein